MITIKEVIPLTYLVIWCILYIVYQFKLTDSARSSRLLLDYVYKQSWFVFLTWTLFVLLVSVIALKR